MTQQTALITGPGSGLGLEFARQLAEQNWNLILAGRTEQKLTAASQELEAVTSGWIKTIPIDLSEAGAAEALYTQVRDSGETVELLINNAGVGLFGEHTTLPDEDTARFGGRGTLNGFQLVLEKMISRT